MKRFVRASVVVVVAMTATVGVDLGAPSAEAAPQAITVSTNREFGCALMVSHSVECWGANNDGQLGDGAASTDNPLPGYVIGISNAVQVSTGDFSACALLSTGRIKCWGYNADGELGDASTGTSTVPVYLRGIFRATKVSAGDVHACAIVAGGAKCWGYNADGELGDASTKDSDVPAQVAGMKKDVTWISSGDDDLTCAVQLGEAKCWGYNGHGQLGGGGTVDRHVPHKVKGLGDHTSIVNAGFHQSCALDPTPKSGMGLECWGENTNGELGNGTTTNSDVPVKASGMQTRVTSISPNYEFTCAVRMGAAKCWGANGDGQIGDGSTTERHLPRQVAGLTSGVVKVSAADFSACAVLGTGTVKCWGLNNLGQLGDNSTSSSSVPVRVHLI